MPEEHALLHEKLKLAIGMNSAAMYDERGNVIGGNPTDQAVMRFLGVETYRAMQENENYRVGQRQTFNSTNKFSQAELPVRGTVVYKGAPEALLARAKYALRKDGQIAPFDEAALDEKNKHLRSACNARAGVWVLGAALSEERDQCGCCSHRICCDS